MQRDIHIVAIGGSAGAASVIETILRALPTDLPAAIFIVLHLQPGDRSWLPQRFERFTTMPVSAPENSFIEAAHVYTAIPDRHLMVKGDHVLSTHGPRENLWRPAIDVLFRSAAVHHATRSIGVLLSGELDDGTAGLQAIATCGGVTIVQRPGDAIFPTMPEVALANATVDHCIDAAGIAPLIVRQVGTTPAAAPPIPDELRQEAQMAEGTSELVTPHFIGGAPTGFSCPECNGPLWLKRGNSESTFRCLVGHAYQLNSLLQAHDSELDRTLWAAIRSFEQRANIAFMMSQQARERGFTRRADLHAMRATEAKAHAQRLRQLQALYRANVDDSPG